jgi:hypothetical protein
LTSLDGWRGVLIDQLSLVFEPFMGRWALDNLMRSYERQYTSLGEEIARALGEEDLGVAARSIGAAQAALLRISRDAIPFVTEMAEACKHRGVPARRPPLRADAALDGGAMLPAPHHRRGAPSTRAVGELAG